MSSLSETVCARIQDVCFARASKIAPSSFGAGVLRLELGKDKYERTGLTGKPIRSGGRKHAKERFGSCSSSLNAVVCLFLFFFY